MCPPPQCLRQCAAPQHQHCNVNLNYNIGDHINHNTINLFDRNDGGGGNSIPDGGNINHATNRNNTNRMVDSYYNS